MMPWENTTTTVDPPPPPPGNPSTPTTTKLFSPEGTLMDLPTENVDKAIQQRGFKRAVPMISPEGATMYLPDEKVANAIIQKFTFADPKTQAAVSEIQRKNRMSANRVAAFPENVPPVEYQFTGEGGSEPVAGTTPMQLWAEQKRNESVNALPQAAVPALNVADKALVKPFQKLAQAGAETGSQIGKAVVSGEAFPPLPWNSAGTAADIQKRQKSFEEKHPAISGTVGALGSTVGGIVADPRMWPLALAGGVAPTLTRGAGAGFSAQMAHGAITQAEELGKILNDPNVPKEQKWEAGASAVIATLLAAKGASGSLKSTTSATPMEASDEGPPLPSLDEVRSALAQIPEPYRPAVLTQVQQKLGLKTKLVHALAGDSASRVPLEPAAGGTSHADVADYAARHNIELTPAQASQSKPLQAIQAVGERSLTNAKPLQDILDRQKGQVAKAVQDFAQRVGNEYAPDPEAVGEHLQSQANEKLAQLRAPIDQRLENLRTTAADLNDPEDVGTNLQNQARGKVAELKQKASQDYDTWRQGTNNLPFDVDLSAVADKYQRQLVEQVEALKNVPGAYASPVRELLEKVANVKSDLPTPEATPVVRNATAQAMRSAYLDIARDQTGNIPSKVQRLASQVAGDISDAMDASATKAGVGDAWKQANQTYRHLMETYQDTDSPLARLLGQTDPTKVTAQVLQKGRFGGNAQTLQMLKTEGYDLSGVKGQVLREIQEKNGDLTKLGYGDDYLRQLFTPDELGQLRDISAAYNELGQHPLQKLATGDPAAITARITAKGRFGGNSRNMRDLAQAGIDLSPVRQQVLNEITQSNFKLTNGGHGLGGYQLPYLKELFEPADLQELLTLGRVVRATKFELNPSGTSNVMTALAQLASRKSPTLAGGLAGFATGGPLGALLGAAGTEVVAPSLAARFSAAPRNVARALGRNPSELLDIPNLPAFLRTKALTGNEDFPVAGGGVPDEEPTTPMQQAAKLGNDADAQATQAIQDAGLVDVDQRNKGADVQRFSHPEKGTLFQVEHPDHPGKTMARYASELSTPEEANRLMNAKLAEFEPKTPMESHSDSLMKQLEENPAVHELSDDELVHKIASAINDNDWPVNPEDVDRVDQGKIFEELFPHKDWNKYSEPDEDGGEHLLPPEQAVFDRRVAEEAVRLAEQGDPQVNIRGKASYLGPDDSNEVALARLNDIVSKSQRGSNKMNVAAALRNDLKWSVDNSNKPNVGRKWYLDNFGVDREPTLNDLFNRRFSGDISAAPALAEIAKDMGGRFIPNQDARYEPADNTPITNDAVDTGNADLFINRALNDERLPEISKVQKVKSQAYEEYDKTTTKALADYKRDYNAALSEPYHGPTSTDDRNQAIAAAWKRYEDATIEPQTRLKMALSPQPQPTFYSPLERAIQAKLPNKFTGEQALNTLRNAGVSADELTTVEPLLKGGGTLTKAEVLEAARQNAIRVQDVWKGGDSSEDDSLNDAYIRAENVHGDEILNNLAQERYHQYFLDLTSSQREELAESDAYQDTIRDYAYDYAHEHPTGTKFSPWQVPGGENYRELLLQKPGYDTRSDSNDPYEQRAARIENNQDFHSSHWDEPNVLGHLRMNDRTDVNGKKTLFLEELQSDWHQQGRQKGYRDPDIEAKKADLEQQMREVAKQIKDSSGDADSSLLDKNRQLAEDWNNLNEQNSSSTVPDAPFKKDWHELLLKRALREAAEGGYDQLAWTPGNVQNERYDLSKQVDELNYEKMADGTYNLSGIKDGKIVIEQSEITSSKLPDYVGKEIANQILSGEHKADFVNGGGIEEGLLEGPDLKVGGAGMRTFYDQIVHNFLNKYAKRWGVKVGSTEIPTEHDASLNTPFENQDKAYAIFDRKGEVYGVSHGHETLITDRDEIKDYKQFVMGDKQPKIMVPVLPITPKMRQDILKGQPISDLRQPHHPTTGTFLPWERGASA